MKARRLRKGAAPWLFFWEFTKSLQIPGKSAEALQNCDPSAIDFFRRPRLHWTGTEEDRGESMRKLKRETWLRVVLYGMLAVASAVMIAAPLGGGNFRTLVSNGITYERGTVVGVLSEEFNTSQVEQSQLLGQQSLRVALKDGQSVLLNNYLTDTHNIRAEAGTAVVVCVDAPEGVEPYYTLYNYDRSGAVALIGALFVGLMVLIGRRRGLDAAIALLFSLLFFLRVTIPAIYGGASPIAIGMLTALVATTVTIVLLHGFHLRSILAIVVTLAGECAACLCFLAFSRLLHISGFQTEEAESLLVVAQNTGLRIKHLLFAATMVSSVGAVMDVAVSLLSALWELRQTGAACSARQLLKSGLNIGRDMIGTMSNTLIFAFAGGALGTILVLFSYGVQANQMLSSDYIAVELAQGVCGTVAVILTVPFASLAAAAIFPRVENFQVKAQQPRYSVMK